MIELKIEAEKWLEKLKGRMRRLEGDKRFIDNIKAYASDSEFFIRRSDYIRAFECVIWAWAWLEIGLEIGKVYEARSAHAREQGGCGEDRGVC